MTLAAVLGLVAAVTTYVGVALFRLWAERQKILDLPNERSSHIRPTPRGGGLVIVVVTLLGGAVLASAAPSLWTVFLVYAAGAILVASVSWIDDLSSLPGPVRFGVHFLGAVIALGGLGYWRALDLPLAGTVSLGIWGALIATVWIVGLTNAYNFMDGTDGIAGSQAFVAGAGWALLGWQAGQPLIGGLGLLVACTSLGFLLHNWPPARIFMGDVGSAFLGYTLAVVPLMYSRLDNTGAKAPLAGLLLVWPFVFDTAFTFLRRLLKWENVFSAHRSHLYQRISSASSGHARVALIYAGLAFAGVVLAQLWFTLGASVIVLVALPVLCLGLWGFVVMEERRRARGASSHLVVTLGRT